MMRAGCPAVFRRRLGRVSEHHRSEAGLAIRESPDAPRVVYSIGLSSLLTFLPRLYGIRANGARRTTCCQPRMSLS